jgi:hypothetical protein
MVELELGSCHLRLTLLGESARSHHRLYVPEGLFWVAQTLKNGGALYVLPRSRFRHLP